MATFKSQSFSAPLFLILLLPVIFAAAAARKGNLVGGWKPITDIKDPHIQEIAIFAVTEYNKVAKPGLKLISVLSGETQVVSGTNYRLVMKAKNGGGVKKYQAVVWERPWENFMKLTSFKPV